MRRSRFSLALSFFLALLVALHHPGLRERDGVKEGLQSRPTPPSHAAASFSEDPGSCLRYLSVYVNAHAGTYVLGLSFGFLDFNQDGEYTPGVDRLEVCVNCQDSCGFGP